MHHHLRFPPRTRYLLAVLAGACGSGDAAGLGPPDGAVPVALQEVASGLSFPLALTAPPGDSRLFIVEKGGAVRVVREGVLLPTPFLDLGGRVSTGGEQGLLDLAFDPAYATNGRFIVHYTDVNGNTTVSAFRVSPGDPDQADPASETVLLTAEQPFDNHNGGRILFGPDGMLYIGLGDGGSGGDPGGRGQSLVELLGDILRVDVTGGTSYTIPPDNPFAGRTDARPELWSVGLRNPWRFDFDPATGDLYVADVGQNAWEEVDVATVAQGAGRGANFGWNVMEGTHCYAAATCDTTGLVLPVLEYSHAEGCSISGGYVYRGAAIPGLQGHYFYADYCSGWVRSFRFQDGQATDPRQWPTLAPGGGIPGFGRDASGELYVLSVEGRVFRIVPQ
ncbi:MAG TPA: PQQ-dependent sugar dehydrogenase [Gemmatimonadales bacterium]|nr:PQQ-dependent sugar dehydrogenase [Gemmatimonadales bacterium]